jgi:V/A-type H+-transporting ATPase subunit D
MSDVTPTRSALLELGDERRAMHEGYVFLDEKCLLLAGEMLRELARYEALAAAFARAGELAFASLQRAVARHGLDGVLAYPTGKVDVRMQMEHRTLMGVRLSQARLEWPPHVPAPADERSPEGEHCAAAFRTLAEAAAPLAASSGNLERLHREYRRSVRRARALQDVLLPEADRTLAEVETRLSELEQEDAIAMHRRA